jgi:cell division protein FtsX
MTLFKVFVVLLLLCVGAGFYRGWFVVSTHKSGAGSSKVDVNLTVDPDKAKADAVLLEQKARGLPGNEAEPTPPIPPRGTDATP